MSAVDALSPWVMTYDPHSAEVEFVGPFVTEQDAVLWGERWQAENGGSPCWNTLNGAPTIRLVVPESIA